jgi:S-DNA-T family DNA segregation ATPase FtsK/SpoIIIE
LPFALVYIAVDAFKREDKTISLNKVAGTLAVELFASGFFYCSWASKNLAGNWSGGHGGHVGSGIGGIFLSFLDKFPAALLFIVLTLVAAFFTFGLSPKIVSILKSIFSRRKAEEDNDLANLKAKAVDSPNFNVNEAVPVEHHGQPAPMAPIMSKSSSLKNTAQKLAVNENHEALTTTTDPNWKFPGMDLLNQKQDKADAGDVNANAQLIQDTYANFNIDVEMEGANIGPRVTQYTLKPPTGVKLTKITSLENNLALDLAAQSIRIEAPIPGKRAVGIEVPNLKAASVRISSLFLSH